MMFFVPANDAAIHVRTVAEFRQASTDAKPGTTILLEPGNYPGGIALSNLHGTAKAPIVIGAAEPAHPPVFNGGGSALQISKVSYLTVRDLTVSGANDNGINVDDGGTYTVPSHHITLRNLRIANLPKGNHDGLKLSGLDDFRVEGCRIEKWGGSAIDMVGCHRGTITGCDFRDGGDSGVQCKGGSAEIRILRCRFTDFGERAVNAGGSTGLPFFRPPIASVPEGKRYEGHAITVSGCTFSGGVTPVAFVGVDGALFSYNTIVNPGRWAFRILQETSTPDFIPSRNGRFERNLVVFRSDQWSAGGVNVGGGTDAPSFRFRENFWLCSDRPQDSKPRLPAPEVGGVYGTDPGLKADLSVDVRSPARLFGAHAYE